LQAPLLTGPILATFFALTLGAPPRPPPVVDARQRGVLGRGTHWRGCLGLLDVRSLATSENTPSRASFAKKHFGVPDGRRSSMRASVHPDAQRPSCTHRATPQTSPTKSGLSSNRVALLSRKARPSAEVAVEARGGRRLLPAAERVFVADAAPRIPAVADGLLSLPQVEDRRPAAPSPRPAS